MDHNDFTTTIMSDLAPSEVFEVILNAPGWWSGLFDESFEGASKIIGDEFNFRAGGGLHYSKQKLVELVPDKKISWLVTESNLSFIENTNEWKGTTTSFEIFKEGTGSKIVFTHIGLVPEIECYSSCTAAWSQYIHEKLHKLIN